MPTSTLSVSVQIGATRAKMYELKQKVRGLRSSVRHHGVKDIAVLTLITRIEEKRTEAEKLLRQLELSLGL